MVTPPALIAATPVGATTIMRFGERSFSCRKKVVFPVPAFPVRNTLTPVCSKKSRANSNCGLLSMFVVLWMFPLRKDMKKDAGFISGIFLWI